MSENMNSKPLQKKRFRVRFRILIDPSRKSTNARKIMVSYRDKFSAFMSSASTTKLTKEDYNDLPLLHELLSNDTTMADIVQAVMSSKKSNELMSIAPVFDIAPMELKAFILLTSGIRSRSLNSCFKTSTPNFEGCLV